MSQLAHFYAQSKGELYEHFMQEWTMKSPENLRLHFKRFNIRCTVSPKLLTSEKSATLFNLKYDSLCNFAFPFTYACRGTTFTIINGECIDYKVGLPKFFNDLEIPKYRPGQTIDSIMSSLENEEYSLLMVNKEDGSNIRFWYDIFGYLHAYTLGTNNEKEMQSNVRDSPTFSGLAIRFLKHFYPKLDDYLKSNPGILCVAEIKSKWNKIVTKYDYLPDFNGSITPLILIHADYRMSWKEIDDLYPELYTNGLPIHSKITTSATYHQDKLDYFQYQSSHPELFGTIPEGFVLYAVKNGGLDCLPVAKGKSPEYIHAHHSVILNVGSDTDFKQAQILKLEEKYDDIEGQIGSVMRDEHIRTMENALREMVAWLDSVQPTLIGYKQNSKAYAEVVKSAIEYNGVWIEWMQPYLFYLRSAISEFDSLNYITQCLLTRKGESYDIELFHIKYGLYWWNKELHLKKVKPALAVASEVEPVITEKHPAIAVFDFDKTLFDEVPLENIIQILQLYAKVNIHILILTGRHIMEEDVVHDVLQPLNLSYTLKCRPSHLSVTIHKCTTMKKLALQYHRIYHFEDNMQTISQCAQIVNSNHGKYAGHLIECGIISQIITRNECVFVALVNPPGSGKTSVFNLLASRFPQVGWISPDKIANTYRETNGEKITPEQMHVEMGKAFKHASESGGIIFVDMCHNKPDILKDIMSCGHPYLIGSFMVLNEIKKKGKTVQVMSKEYGEFISANVTHRIQSKDMNGSTLDCANAVDIALKKAEGCVHQIIQRNIPLFAQEILPIEQMANIVYSQIIEKLSTTPSHAIVMINSSGEKIKVDKTKFGEYVVQFI
jgi:hypothetical protein